jgi:acetyltransferase-like isoleucine patch superfamily enzyme
MKKIIVNILYILGFDRVADSFSSLLTDVRLMRLKEAGANVGYIQQGRGGVEISGDLTKFSIHPTSHLKSDTFIECSGGVKIGRYFHVGRGLTIFSSAHNYKESTKIPYDENVLPLPVNIGDFVWCGANVFILPGVQVGEGAIIGAGSVVTKDVPARAVIGGNPAEVISERDPIMFEKCKINNLFY